MKDQKVEHSRSLHGKKGAVHRRHRPSYPDTVETSTHADGKMCHGTFSIVQTLTQAHIHPNTGGGSHHIRNLKDFPLCLFLYQNCVHTDQNFCVRFLFLLAFAVYRQASGLRS